LEFEWHDAKAEANLRTHGVSFGMAKAVFKDPFALEWLDDREDYGEERFVMIGMAETRYSCLWPIRNAGSAFASFRRAE
jgi:uncharacterized DUF497 family protein